MASVEDRVASLVDTHLGISDRAMLDVSTGDLGVNSMDAVSFLKMVNQEFGISISPAQAVSFTSLRDLIKHVEALQ